MRSGEVAELLAMLQVCKSHSRPYCSNDNPYSESQFKTMKYAPEYPERFGSLQDARVFSAVFFAWYNTEHRHSGIAMLTPASVHYGSAHEVLAGRNRVLAEAYQRHPERFVKGQPNAGELPEAVWINKPAALVVATAN
jgi:putative transposase